MHHTVRRAGNVGDIHGRVDATLPDRTHGKQPGYGSITGAPNRGPDTGRDEGHNSGQDVINDMSRPRPVSEPGAQGRRGAQALFSASTNCLNFAGVIVWSS